jgi:hypothetical protein
VAAQTGQDTARRGGTPASGPRPTTGYALVLPGGWRRIPMRHGTKRAVTGILDEVFGRLPPSLARDKITPYRLELERRLHGMIRQARSKGALDLYLPVEYVHGVAVPASFIVSRGMLGGGEFLDASQIVATMAAESADASPVTVDDVTGVRFERIAEPDRTQEISAASRRVDYVLPVPGLPGDWLVLAFSTLGDGHPEGQFTRLLVELFDAIVSTFRWTRS